MADLIDRDALILKQKHTADLFADSTVHDDIVRRYEATAALAEIINAPAVNRWIPCSERLPENKCGVIFTVDRGHPFVCVGYRIHSERGGLLLTRWFDKLSGLNFSDYDVKAWMPMPDAYEPPKE